MPTSDNLPKDVGLHQEVVIKNLKRYFKDNHLPFQINSEGLCNGLASVYAKYALEGKETKFFEILKYVSSGNAAIEGELTNEDLNNFIVDVLHSYNPQIKDTNLSLMRSMEALTIDGQPAKSSYDLSLVMSDANWSQIISDLGLVEHEVAKICSTNHAVSIRKNATGGYTLYDPNYAEGFKNFKDETSLVEELHHHVFKYRPGNMALSISIVRHPNAPKREIPEQSTLINRYITTDSIKDKAQPAAGMATQSLTCAAKFDDVAAVQALLNLKPDEDDILKAAIQAATHNCVEVFNVLLPHINMKKRPALYMAAANNGRKSIFDILTNNDAAYSSIMKTFLTQNTSYSIMHSAAASGNLKFIEHILGDGDLILTDEQLSDKILSKDTTGEDCITKAIKSGSAESVNYLMLQVHDRLTDLDKLHYLIQAIEANQATVVESLIQKVPPEYLSGIHMNMPAIDQTQLLILKTLKEHGVSFGAKEDMKINTLLDRAFKVDLGTRFSMFLADVKEWFTSTFGNVQQYMTNYVKPAFVVKEDKIEKAALFKERMSIFKTSISKPESSSSPEEDEDEGETKKFP